ncbi:MAG TPA: 50S ribosomal protein L11 methyltransferase [Gaiellaceae bacterium]|nr:50S ribosomal protein L11 methyltransferase [Gaiellaceae bacterium]HWJ45560.1 50S ribosomal protein L11 methyltransferase [Gaiellaceae bacterium]
MPAERIEEARARMLALFPQGFEEVDGADGIELVAYTDAAGEEQLWHVFGGARGEDVAADWRDRWKAFHHPVRVGSFWIGPPWIAPPDDATAVVIEPGRAFGTGAHPTTRLCIELMLDLERGSVLDLGCGSGVLSIVAAKLGFAPVVAFDSDVNAVEATRANAAANGVDVDGVVGDALAVELPALDVAVANITRPTLEALAPRLPVRRLIGSGYLPTDEAALEGFRHLRRVTRDSWAADLYEAA